MKSTTIIYNQNQRAFRLWGEWARRVYARYYPDTGGSEHLIHNWYRCSRDAHVSEMAGALIDHVWRRWRRIDERYERLYDRAEHKDHDGRFKPLWCEYCQGR